MLSLFLALGAALCAHPNSHSSSRVTVDGARVALELRCQTQSLIECLDIDGDGDGRLDAVELERSRAAVGEYLAQRYQLFVDAAAATALPLELVELTATMSDASAFAEQLVDARFDARAPAELERLTVRCRLFTERNPFHRDSATIVWHDDAPAAWLFAEGVELWRFEPADVRRPGVLKSYVALGVEHIAGGYDHIAFLLALLVASRRLRSIAGVVTAFTAAHSVTLAAAALGWIDVPGRLVEMAIALSIAYVAAENLAQRRPAARWLEAFGFGLIHGLGFAGALGESLVSEPLRITALVGFNCGVELGQLAIVGLLALVLHFLPGDRSLDSEARAWITPRWARVAASSLIVVLGLYWFGARAGWIA